ncbi:hypothetical protein [uncultured Nostoc sp.]|uniref:hypothetical protein n=1 Tax=uncultured Nostoc sp. TaxID=340711 RepID=UPI0035C9F8B5
MVNYLKEHCFQYKQKCFASTIFALAASFLGLIASGCSQHTAIFPNAEDIANLQKTADWLLEQKIIPQRVDITTAVCPLGTTAAR